MTADCGASMASVPIVQEILHDQGWQRPAYKSISSVRKISTAKIYFTAKPAQLAIPMRLPGSKSDVIKLQSAEYLKEKAKGWGTIESITRAIARTSRCQIECNAGRLNACSCREIHVCRAVREQNTQGGKRRRASMSCMAMRISLAS